MHNILTALHDGDESIIPTAHSIIPQLNHSACWVIKNSTERRTQTLDILEAHPNIKVVYCQDDSLYEGLNQGLRYCTGEFFQVIGAGDRLRANTLNYILDSEAKSAHVDSLFFAVNHSQTNRELIPNPQELSLRMACPHPGAVLKTAKVRELGGFDTTYRIASDYDLISRYVKVYGKVMYTSQVVIDFEGGGLSERRAVEAFIEEELIRFRIWEQSQSASVLKASLFFSWARERLGLVDFPVK